MATRTIKPHREESILDDFESLPERAPSAVRTGPGAGAQVLLFIGFFLVLVGTFALGVSILQWGTYVIGPGPGYIVLSLGVTLILIHCYLDPEEPFRRFYTLAGFAMILGAGVTHVVGSYFLPLGLPLLLVAFLFLFGAARNETAFGWRRVIQSALLVVGFLFTIVGLVFGHYSVDFLTTEGVPLLILGIVYLSGYLGLCDERVDDRGYRTALAIGAVGLTNLAITLARSWSQADFLVPAGLILIAISVLHVGLCIFLAADWPLVVLTRRELLAFFYSPVAYLVLFGVCVIFGFHFFLYVNDLSGRMTEPGPPVQPITMYIMNWLPIMAVVMIVPVVTMRLFAEEKRTGSLEVLLTAPISEWSIVLGKFLATLIFFIVAWLPFFVMMIALRVVGGTEFDWRPLLSFFLGLISSGAGFLAMGLFFSSLTSNQIVAAVLTFAGMLLHLGLTWLQGIYRSGLAQEVLQYVSFLWLWFETSRGNLPVRYLAFHASVAVFFLFLTHQVLTARKWK
jgi:ABC-type transport system involved in multi-copper enzyme maturation permease subunit